MTPRAKEEDILGIEVPLPVLSHVDQIVAFTPCMKESFFDILTLRRLDSKVVDTAGSQHCTWSRSVEDWSFQSLSTEISVENKLDEQMSVTTSKYRECFEDWLRYIRRKEYRSDTMLGA